MNKTLLTNMMDMAKFANSSVNFSQVYAFDNGTEMVVSRNEMTPGFMAGYMAVLPVDRAGNQIDERAETWLGPVGVAEKMEILASE